MTDLGTLGTKSRAVAINNRGQIIGWSQTESGTIRAVLWTKSGA
jgi:probable HAF family extracellular repeat protein